MPAVAFITLAALIGLLPLEDSLMLDQTHSLAEGLSILFTVVLLLHIVNSSVMKEPRTATEGFPTLITFVESFSSVSSLVLDEPSSEQRSSHTGVVCWPSGFSTASLLHPYARQLLHIQDPALTPSSLIMNCFPTWLHYLWTVFP